MQAKLTTEEIQKLLDDVNLSNGDEIASKLFDNHNHFGYPDCIDSFIDYDSESNKIIIFHNIDHSEDISTTYSIEINTASEYESLISMSSEELNQFVIDNSTNTKHYDFTGLEEKIKQYNDNTLEQDKESEDEFHERVLGSLSSELERRQYQQFLNNSY